MKNILSLLLLLAAIAMIASCIAVSNGNSAFNGQRDSVTGIPSYSYLPVNPKLPDPFKFLNNKRVATKKQWKARRAEIATLAQEFEYGYKPNTPATATIGTFIANVVTVNVTYNGKTISFNCTITYPTTGSKPYPAMIGIGASNLNNTALLNMGVAVINFPNNTVAQQTNGGSRGKGLFYDMFGNDHSASATMAWAWGVSRLIDALEKTSAAGIDAYRLGVTGCSRNGKGALVVGAFDERIKLTIPQEPGAGGAASWRISNAQKAAGKNVQTLSQIVTENVWFRANFSQFSNVPISYHLISIVYWRCVHRGLY
ncbi:hypothetical protein ACFQ3S_07115 [Mucilaginibacter terrae]|uniref:glucuronyl esterase domain-containing protein n=1 Tax=Mucilaginibacter terrae TaxID=1955052 RepID=UPI00362D43CE